jgi:hypothetical protein
MGSIMALYTILELVAQSKVEALELKAQVCRVDLRGLIKIFKPKKPRRMVYSQIKRIFKALLLSHVGDCDECYCHQLIS